MCREAWKRPYCTGMLQVRRLLAQGDAEDWDLASLLPSLRRLQPPPHLLPCPGNVQEVGLQCRLSKLPAPGEKRSPSLLPLAVSSLGALGGVWKYEPLTPAGIFLAFSVSPPVFCRYSPARVPLTSNRLKLPAPFIL